MADQEVEDAAKDYTDLTLSRRPGFLIRRLHQVHLAFFAQECASFDTTPLQSSVLTTALRQPGLEQSRLAEAVGVDRATLAQVVSRLEKRGLIVRESHKQDRRLKLVSVTPEGKRMVESMTPATARAHARVMAPVTEAERKTFLDILGRLVDANNGIGRAPLR